MKKLNDRMTPLPFSALMDRTLNGHNDHRIVMAMAVAALAAGQPAVIEGANAVNKSWPDFFEVIKGLGAHVTNQG